MKSFFYLFVFGVSLQLSALEVERTPFVQQKHFKHLSQPISSEGEMVLIPGAGLLYRIIKPIQASYLMGQDALVIEEVGKQRRLSADEAPWLKAMRDIFPALIRGDIDSLSAVFTVEKLPTEKGFAWRCVPKSSAFRKALPEIVLRGETHVSSVRYQEANGAITDLILSAPEKGGISAHEQHLLTVLRQ